MNRLTVVKLMGAALVGTALLPFSGFAKPSQAELDTLEVERVIREGGTLRNRIFKLTRTLVIDETSSQNFDIQRCTFLCADEFEGDVMVLVTANALGGVFEGNTVDLNSNKKKGAAMTAFRYIIRINE